VNKTLLIIICDFLLISILALVEFKPQVEIAEPDSAELKENAAEEMLELLQLSLEQENAERAAVEAALSEKESALAETSESLAEKETLIREKEQIIDRTTQALAKTDETLRTIQAEKAAVATELSQTQSTLELTLEEKSGLADALRQREAQSRQLQDELARQREETAAREAALSAAQENLESLEQSQQQLSTQLKIRETESAILQQNLVAARAEVERARVEAERAQQRTESLAAGVSELAASSSQLKEEIQKAQPVSMNALFKAFEDNKLDLLFRWRERLALGLANRETRLQSIIIEKEGELLAVFSTKDTPLAATRAQDIQLILELGEKAYAIREISYLTGDESIAAFRIPSNLAESANIEAFNLTTDPFRFAEAILISSRESVYGEIPVRVPPGESSQLDVESRLFNRLFGEFSPAPGDYVFSLTGELIGIMNSNNRARILSSPEFVSGQSLTLPQ
jgi:hypothetical protein